MSKLLAIVLLLLPLTNHGTYLATAWDDKDFFKYCPPSQCSQHGPEIRYPFCLESSNKSSSSCGCGGRTIRKIACSGQDTILVHPVFGPYSVSAIDYKRSSMKITPLVDTCLVLQQKLIISRSSSSPQVDVLNHERPSLDRFFLWSSTNLVHCSREFAPGAADRIAGPLSCISNITHFFYLVAGYEDMSLLPLDCKVVPVSDGVGGRLKPMYWSCGQIYDPRSFKEAYSVSHISLHL